MSGKTRDEEWFIDDQTQWFEEQKRDEEELQQLREAEMREHLMGEVIEEFKRLYLTDIHKEAVVFARKFYGQGFVHGFAAALLGAVAFIYFA